MHRIWPRSSVSYAHSHNAVLEILLQYGLAGLVAAGLITARIGWAAWKRKRPEVLLVLAGLAITNMTDYTIGLPAIYTLSLIILSSAQSHALEKNKDCRT